MESSEGIVGKGLVGMAIRRNEDPRLLTGRALFVDDVTLPDMAHVAFLRSPYAHARILAVDTSEAAAMEGVLAVMTADDLGDYWQPGPLLVPPPPVEGLVFHQRCQVPLAKGKVRHVGEPVAVVVATSRYVAEDAAERIVVDWDPLDAVVGLEAALAPGAPRVHEDLESNLAAFVPQRKGDWAAARARADVVISRRYDYDRGAAAAIENRGVVAQWDARADRLTIWDTTQAPIPVRNGLASMLGLSEHQVRLVAPFIGGGFGPKIMMFYPEEVLVPWLAMRLGRPVKWIEDRAENFFATTQERGQLHDAEMALTRDGEILGIRDSFLHDTGAYDPYGLTVPLNSQCTLLGPYRVPAYESDLRAVFTNKPIVTPYRGAGRQHGVFVVERLLDAAARELGIDRVEIRRRNLLRPDEFPVDNVIVYQDFAPLYYDSGDYEPLIEDVKRRMDWDRLTTEELPRLRAAGRAVGAGLVCYVEGTGIGPFEGARVQVQTSGKVTVVTGIGTQGQGHYTVFAQLAAAQLGVEVADVEVVTGDSDQFHWGTGTFASRGAVVAGNAVHAAAKEVREKALRTAGRALGVMPEAVELVGGVARVAAEPGRAVPLGELARLANPMRGAVEPGTEPGLEATKYFGPYRGATASGCHGMVLEVDRDTFAVKVEKYVVVHDCGRVLNPLLVDGQVHGGVAQGLGNAWYEQLVWGDTGQLLNASFMDFLLPTALDVPRVEVGHLETPSPLNELGTKGAGEAGAIPTAALFAQALEDALQVPGLEIREIPLRPSRLWELVREAEARSAGGEASA
jgi:carbon-monoxide dehydrogenase large subunit